MSSKDSSIVSSPFFTPNVGALLKIKVISWSQETGLPVSVSVRIGNRIFNLHKHQLCSKSGYFKKRLDSSDEVELPPYFPGGPQTFEMIALFIYGSSTLIDPFNVASLRCAAEFLEMTEEHCTGNLCQRFDLYLNQVVLQSWDDTLIVLQKCQALLPWSEELLIVSRCIESLAFMACMEILDPERRRERPVITLEAFGQAWSCKLAKEIASLELWIKDLIALPFGIFRKVIGSLRRQGMKEKYVSPIVLFYANKWVLSSKTHKFQETSGDLLEENDTNINVAVILEGVLDLLQIGERASKTIPVGFYFALLSRSLEFGLRANKKAKLQDQVSSLLHFAQVEDFLFPKNQTDSISSCMELVTMQSIFSKYVSFNVGKKHTPTASNSIVAELWDAYLSHVAPYREIDSKRFMELIETVPASCRQSHDQLYRALNTFLQARPHISQEEKGAVCKYLNCQKLSQEACIDAVQNEVMPLRFIVQALFAQQINTHQAFKECSESFRYAQYGEFSGSLASSGCPISKGQNPVDSPYTDGAEPASRSLTYLLQKEHAEQKSEFESTSFRIQNLEQELMSLKRNLDWHNFSKFTETVSGRPQSAKLYGPESRSFSKKRSPLGEVTGCIGSVNFSSQRKYASRLLKVVRRISLFGSRKSKEKTSAADIWPQSK